MLVAQQERGQKGATRRRETERRKQYENSMETLWKHFGNETKKETFLLVSTKISLPPTLNACLRYLFAHFAPQRHHPIPSGDLKCATTMMSTTRNDDSYGANLSLALYPSHKLSPTYSNYFSASYSILLPPNQRHQT